MGWVREDGFRVNNLDATIVAERPKLATHIPSMREKLSDVLDTRLNQINIKATTTEGLGFCGKREGMEAFSIVSLVSTSGE